MPVCRIKTTALALNMLLLKGKSTTPFTTHLLMLIPPAELLELDLVTNLAEGLCGSMWTTRVEFDHVGLHSAAVELTAGSLFHFLVL